MSCDYYVQSELVIEYIDKQGRTCKTRTNRTLLECYIRDIPEYNVDDEEEIKNEKYKNELEKTIIKNTYKKMLYETEHWIKDTYEKRYYKKLAGLCPGIIKVIMVYKDYTAWKQR